MAFLTTIRTTEVDSLRLQYAITGTGYCGTQYTAKLLCSVDVPCSHEQIFTTAGYPGLKALSRNPGVLRHTNPRVNVDKAVAESSTFLGRNLDHPVVKEAKIIHLVRHPLLILRTQKSHHANLEYACNWWYDSNLLIEKYEDEERYHRIRIEDYPMAILTLVDRADRTGFFSSTDPVHRNSKWVREKNPTELHWSDIPNGNAKRRMMEMARRYGYDD